MNSTDVLIADARRERSSAQAAFLKRLVPSREWVLASAAIAAFAVVAWVYAA
jgi:hypothetical protein